MRSLPVLILIIVVLAILGYFFFIAPGDSAPAEENSETAQQEEQNAEAPDAEATRANIVGTWQSNEDEKSVRVFKADGTVEDHYDGEVLSSGSWEVFTDPAVDPNVPVIEGATYLKITDNTEVFHYTVAELSAESLALIYLNRGGTLTYSRVVE